MFRQPIDNSGLIIPFYSDRELASGKDREGYPLQFPCDCRLIRYDKRVHRYFLTEEGMIEFGISAVRGGGSFNWLSRTATDHLYSYIHLMSQTKQNAQDYRLAKGWLGRNTQFKDARFNLYENLCKQAEFINDFGDGKKTPKVAVMQAGRSGQKGDSKLEAESGFWLLDDVLVWLRTNWLLDPNLVWNAWDIDWSKY